MRYLSASPLSVGLIQMFATLGTLIGLFYVEFTLQNILIALVFYIIYSGVGIGITLHRYYTHHSFEFRSSVIKYIFTFFALLCGRGSVIGWVHVHREHHAYSDTDKDPHIKNMSMHKVFLPAFTDHGLKINKFLIRDLLNPIQLKINQYYLPLVLIPVITLMLIDIKLAYLCWFLPVFLTNVLWNLFIWFGHNSKFGHQSFSTDDVSVNSWLFAFLMLGEGWHNNHHKYPKNYTTKVKWFEFDLLGLLIKCAKK